MLMTATYCNSSKPSKEQEQSESIDIYCFQSCMIYIQFHLSRYQSAQCRRHKKGSNLKTPSFRNLILHLYFITQEQISLDIAKQSVFYYGFLSVTAITVYISLPCTLLTTMPIVY